MLIYNTLVTQLTEQLGFPEMGEAFEGHPDDNTILEEYYLWDSPDLDTVRAFLKNRTQHQWTLDSNVLTFYK